MRIYLAGKVPKGDDIGKLPDWRLEYVPVLASVVGAQVLSPEDALLDESQSLLVFGHDCHLVKAADAIIVNASTKLGVGTAQEMVIAKYFRKPVVTVLPKDTHHRRTNLAMPAGVVADWIHPFLYSTSDAITETLETAAAWLADYARSPSDHHIKGLEIIDDAINAYLRSHG